jgi:hypothetical protein
LPMQATPAIMSIIPIYLLFTCSFCYRMHIFRQSENPGLPLLFTVCHPDRKYALVFALSPNIKITA